MIVGIPKEIKEEEYRVGILPKTVKKLVKNGHKVIIEKNAGIGAGIKDIDYEKSGAEIVEDHSYIFKNSELIVKVKEPLPSEYNLLQESQILFTFFHFSSNKEMTETLIEKKVTCIAYELVEEKSVFVILKPMSEIAGKLSIQQGMKYLEKEYGGKGVLLSGVEGVRSGKVVILGGGTVGYNAGKIADSIGAEVTILEINEARIKFLKKNLPRVKVLYSNEKNIKNSIKKADLIIGAVLIPGRRPPILVKKEDLKNIEEGTVMIDVSIDEGGVFETSHPTTHKQPIYKYEGIIHYCVPNIPGIVPRTSTFALCNVTEKYILQLANKGIKSIETSYGLKTGLAILNGKIVNPRLKIF
ncbi:MAG: alanine dehydrogenase [Candidatus Omnitrophica bacterium]|nr:alanine dehydrogenase [Candidatus Omnitrophota bacterium]MCM8802267.1 alanine dehydrogenase [Candidatus Omnitrophota bacterium]